MTLREMFKLPNCRRKQDTNEEGILEERYTNKDKKSISMEIKAVYCNVAVQTDELVIWGCEPDIARHVCSID